MFDGELRRQKALFAVTDEVALLGAFAVALGLHDPDRSMASHLRHLNLPLAFIAVIVLAFLWVLIFHAFDLYRMRNGGLDESIAVLKACTVASLLTMLLIFFTHQQLSRLTLTIAYMLSTPLVLAARGVTRKAMKRLYAVPGIATPLVVIGFNPVAQYVCDQILDKPTQYELLGFLDSSSGEYRDLKVLGDFEKLAELAANYSCLEAAVVLPEAAPDYIAQIIKLCESHRVRWCVVPSLFRSLASGLRLDMLGIVPLIGPRRTNIEGLNFIIKRGFDLGIAAPLLALASPLLLLVAAAIRLLDGQPILFRQTRIGMFGKPFQLLKFRTMRIESSDSLHREYVKNWIGKNGSANGGHGSPMFKLTADPRITALGQWLRRFSIDELPQLVNVLRGEMSLIGPRPALPYEIEFYQEWHRRRLDAPPGITGLWQVSGRNRLSFEDMVRLDIEYIEDWSLASDLKIMLRTLPTMLHGGGL